MYFNYTDYDAVSLAKLIKTRQVSPEEVLDAAIHQIEVTNPALNAVITKLYDQAHAQLQELDLSLPLAGVPMLLKDLLADYKGIPTSFGSKWLKDFPVPENSELVNRYLRAGLIIVGKTNVPEFGLGAVTEPAAFGPTKNPCNPTITPGGSSGGSAAAVAAKMVPIAHANDGGGSIRIPASCCGLFGLKPTRGRTPTGSRQFRRGWNGLITEHVLTRTVRDSAVLLDISSEPWGGVAGLPTPTKSYSHQLSLSTSPLKIGFTMQSFFGDVNVHPDCIAAVNTGLKQCVTLGHQLEEVKLSFDAEQLRTAYATIVSAEVKNMLNQFAKQVGHGPARREIELATATIASFGQHYTGAEYAHAAVVMDQATWQLEQYLQHIDVLVTPVLSKPPVPIGYFQPKWYEQMIMQLLRMCRLPWLMNMIESALAKQIFDYVAYTPLCNLTGHPAMSVPFYKAQENIPIGVHFIGRMGDEATLLHLAYQLEEAGGFVK
jgi:amidase